MRLRCRIYHCIVIQIIRMAVLIKTNLQEFIAVCLVLLHSSNTLLHATKCSRKYVFINSKCSFVQYKGPASDANILGEMIFGAVAVNCKRVSLKIHIMEEPKRYKKKFKLRKNYCLGAGRIEDSCTSISYKIYRRAETLDGLTCTVHHTPAHHRLQMCNCGTSIHFAYRSCTVTHKKDRTPNAPCIDSNFRLFLQFSLVYLYQPRHHDPYAMSKPFPRVTGT